MQEIFTSWQPAAELAPREVLGPVADELRGLIAARAPMLPGCSTARLFGLDLLRGQRDGVASALVEAALRGQRTTVAFINAHCINTLKRDAGYAQALQAADFLLPDGSGMAIAARLAGEELGDNLNGTDLFPLLCAHAAERGASIYLLGGKPGIAAAAAATMRSRYPGLRVAGTHHGYVARRMNPPCWPILPPAAPICCWWAWACPGRNSGLRAIAGAWRRRWCWGGRPVRLLFGRGAPRAAGLSRGGHGMGLAPDAGTAPPVRALCAGQSAVSGARISSCLSAAAAARESVARGQGGV
jgi:hypothetical protein